MLAMYVCENCAESPKVFCGVSLLLLAKVPIYLDWTLGHQVIQHKNLRNAMRAMYVSGNCAESPKVFCVSLLLLDSPKKAKSQLFFVVLSASSVSASQKSL